MRSVVTWSCSVLISARVDWLGRIADVCDVARTNGLECGLILNSEGGGKKSNEVFAEDTLAFARLVQQRGLGLDHLIVRSWYPFPTSVVGDTLPAQRAVAAEVARLSARSAFLPVWKKCGPPVS